MATSTKSLKKQGSDLAQSNKQLEILSNGIFQNGELPTFKQKIAETNQFPLKAKKLVARETFSLVHQFHKSGLALSVKGCGAMGADVILVVCEKKNLLAVKNLAQVVGLKWIADSNEIESGLEVHFDFDVNIKNKESQDEDVVVQ